MANNIVVKKKEEKKRKKKKMVPWKKGNTLLINQKQAKEKWTIWAILSIFQIFLHAQNWGNFLVSH